MRSLSTIFSLILALSIPLRTVGAKSLVKPLFTSLANREIPDGELEYDYMTKDRGLVHDGEKGTKSQSTQTGEGGDGENGEEGKDERSEEEEEKKGENENEETTTEKATEGTEDIKKNMDDVPLATMQAPSSTVKNKTDSSVHRGDTSTFVTNNFYNPAEKEHGELTAGAQLQYEYLWKRIYDIDSKLLNLAPIHVDKTKDPLQRKGLTITFDPESNPDQHTVNIDDSIVE
ncbi:signal peptide-containing protein [Theileria equi strain WA]|uniref:Signal peptide-containing protein n=1 Tax=Theileria equi strain WA TaxID=1537102 RepID=L0AZJ8_THEEQ|nr:signal peptide-containing protein [Theileria equi strain WA]AFZ80985.1 signal peptide-containing protein [Theileria equi strain WA]|eukprot:XP_004830651.1 signal peptide-containing protein [Theileria equi strain WA]